MDTSHLQGRWYLSSVNGQPIKSKQQIYFQIDGSKITGFDGCNNFGGRLDDPSRLVMSQRACASQEPPLPLKLTDLLPQLKAARIADDRLFLSIAASGGEAEFKRR